MSTGTAVIMEQRPLMLLVEDNLESLSARVEIYEDAGLTVLTAASAEDAIRQIWSSPMVCAVVTDLNLEPSDTDDTAGVYLCKYLREVRPGLPVAGYSAHFDEAAVAETDRELFDRYYARGSLTVRGIADSAAEIRELAIEFRDLRREEALKRLDTLRKAQCLDLAQCNFYQSLLPREDSWIEQVLTSSGYELLTIVSPPAPISKCSPRLATALLVWVRSGPDGVESEVFGMPNLYAAGADLDEAITGLLEIMCLFFEDLREADDLVGEALDLQRFLVRVIEQ